MRPATEARVAAEDATGCVRPHAHPTTAGPRATALAPETTVHDLLGRTTGPVQWVGCWCVGAIRVARVGRPAAATEGA